MRAHKRVVRGCYVSGLVLVAVGAVGCTTSDRVVVRDRDRTEVVRVRNPQPVVEERVVVRP